MDRHSRLGGNVLIKPLDSGLRRNDGKGNRQDIKRLLECLYPPIVIPAKARLQGCRR